MTTQADVFPIARGEYGELAALVVIVQVLTFVIPIAAIALFGRRV